MFFFAQGEYVVLDYFKISESNKLINNHKSKQWVYYPYFIHGIQLASTFPWCMTKTPISHSIHFRHYFSRNFHQPIISTIDAFFFIMTLHQAMTLSLDALSSGYFISLICCEKSEEPTRLMMPHIYCPTNFWIHYLSSK